jgi:hypothetical protein
MVDAGWSALEVAAHYQADRDWRAAVKRLRRKGVVPTTQAIKEYRRSIAKADYPGTATSRQRA